MTLREKIERLFSIIYQIWVWSRFALAMAITFFVLFYVPWVVAGWGWDSPQAQGGFVPRAIYTTMPALAWYGFLYFLARPLWYMSWANAATALDMSLRYIESRR